MKVSRPAWELHFPNHAICNKQWKGTSEGIEGADAEDLEQPSSSSDSLGLVGALLVDTGPQPGRSAFSPGERLLYRLRSDVALDGADGGVILERIGFSVPIPFRSNARKADGSQRRYGLRSFVGL